VREPSYAAAPVAVREDLAQAHREAWRRLAAAGAWWTGAERVAIAAAARAAARCPLCRERREVLSPGAPGGRHADAGGLPEPAVEAAHRIASDPARLSRGWREGLRAAGLGDAAYVELVGVVATLVGIDAFCRALSLPPHPLPEPLAGEPSRHTPAAARDEGAFVPMLPNRRPSGPEADLWDTPRTGNVIRALSLVPDEVRMSSLLAQAHYLGVQDLADPALRRGALDRPQIELVAARVSARNECFY
jgi:hypothetical protein